MSLLTRCPACTTIYRVVPDQLRISQGWVKCGQCGDIFDATQHLVQIEPVAPAGQSLPVDETAPDRSLQTGPPLQDTPKASTTTELESPQHSVPTASTDAEVDVPAPDETPSLQPTSMAGEVSVAGTSTPLDEPPKMAPMRASAIDPEPEPDLEPAAIPAVNQVAAQLEDLSFMRDARKAQRWLRPWVRAALLVLALLLAGLLPAQWVWQQRDVLAVRWPTYLPVLKSACDIIGCKLQSVQRIESVLIDSATFNKLDNGRFLLNCVLKNTAELPLALPSIELTLTDLQDRAVVRRVFAGHELDAAMTTLLPLSEWRVSVPLALTLADASPQIVGYRVRVFYP